MTLTLDPQLEQRIQREMARGHYTDPSDVINRALDSLDDQTGWSDEEKTDLDRHLSESMESIKRGEGVPGNQLREVLAQRRAKRTA